jgi:NAD(P)-dependent dehydrogenase (short-subunit alcohol dehydrogenase family)
MALDHGREAIRVNAICPGYIETPLMERWLASLPDRDETLAQLRRFHPVERYGNARDVAEQPFSWPRLGFIQCRYLPGTRRSADDRRALGLRSLVSD